MWDIAEQEKVGKQGADDSINNSVYNSPTYFFTDLSRTLSPVDNYMLTLVLVVKL